MRILIVYKSVHHKNTEKIVNAFKDVLKSAEIKQPEDVNPENIGKYDLIGFGSGVYFQKIHKSILSLIDKLPESTNKKAFVFATSGMRELPVFNAFFKTINNKLKNKGFNIIDSFDCRGWDTWSVFKYIGGISQGHPNKKDIKAAKKFDKKIKRRL